MYMRFPHNHPKCLAAKQKKQDSWKGYRKTSKATVKRKAPDNDPAPNAVPAKLSLSMTFNANLTSKVYLSDQETDLLFNKA